MTSPVFFAHAGDERVTPQPFYESLDKEFHFDIDCAAGPLNHKCDLYFGFGGVATDALEEDWNGYTCFLNPPYSAAGAFVEKARIEANKGATVVLVLPVRSDTKWWHKYVWDATIVRSSRRREGYPAEGSPDGDWREGVRGRLLPGRLNFELRVPDDLRTWIKQELTLGADVKDLSNVTGLPAMAITRIGEDYPDDCLLESAPFPSCVLVFTGVSTGAEELR